MARIVLDSNVWISAYLVGNSQPRLIVNSIRDNKHKSYTSEYILDEIERSLSKPKMRDKYETSSKLTIDYIGFIKSVSNIVSPVPTNEIKVRDPNDSIIVETALGAAADYLITGDHDFLNDDSLRKILDARGIKVVSPREFNSSTQLV